MHNMIMHTKVIRARNVSLEGIVRMILQREVEDVCRASCKAWNELAESTLDVNGINVFNAGIFVAISDLASAGPEFEVSCVGSEAFIPYQRDGDIKSWK